MVRDADAGAARQEERKTSQERLGIRRESSQ